MSNQKITGPIFLRDSYKYKKQGLLINLELYKNMKWKDRLSSLILGEQDEQKPTNTPPKPRSGLALSLRRLITTSRSPHSEKSAAGAQGNTKWAREGKPYLKRYGGGENVAHNVGTMASLKSTIRKK